MTTDLQPNHPSTDSAEALLRRQARRRVDMKIGWLTHALVFALVNGGLYFLNGMGSDGGHSRWHMFPLWGWGLGLTIHGLVVLLALSTGDLRERMLAGELDRLKQQQRRAG